MVQFEKLFVIFAVVGIFVLAMISFGVNLQESNDVNDTILNNDVINHSYHNLDTTLSNSKDNSSRALGSFENETASGGFGSLVFFTIPSAMKIVRGLITGVFSILIQFPAQILGISPSIIAILEAILLILIIVSLWRLYKSGA